MISEQPLCIQECLVRSLNRSVGCTGTQCSSLSVGAFRSLWLLIMYYCHLFTLLFREPIDTTQTPKGLRLNFSNRVLWTRPCRVGMGTCTCSSMSPCGSLLRLIRYSYKVCWKGHEVAHRPIRTGSYNYIKRKISKRSPRRSFNRSHCLNELNEPSLVQEVQQY